MVTPTEAALVLCSVPLKLTTHPWFYLRACLFQTKHSIGGQRSGLEPSCSTTSDSLGWEAACMLPLSARCLVGQQGWLSSPPGLPMRHEWLRACESALHTIKSTWSSCCFLF